MDNPFIQIGLVLGLATVLGALMRFLKQPLVLAYILAGFVLTLFGLVKAEQNNLINLLSQFGIAFLLFMVGLELKVNDLKQLGRNVLIIGILHIFIIFSASFLLSLLLGLSLITSLFFGIALTFSSTVIVVMLLSENNDINSLYGKIAIGLLLIQDFVAILVLMFLPGFVQANSASFLPFLLIFAKGLGLFLVISFLVKTIIPWAFSQVAKNQELLFMAAVAWCLVLATIAKSLGFSYEIGAFLAGISLSSLPYHYQISTRIRPLRDLFIALFFTGLGMQVVIRGDMQFLYLAVILSLFVIISHPLVMLILVGFLGFRKRTSFLSSMTLGQISEFSLIIGALGFQLGYLTQSETSLLTTVGIATIAISTYMAYGSKYLYERLTGALSFFERDRPSEKRMLDSINYKDHVILVGCHRMGKDILEFLKKDKMPYLVLDFDPDVIEELEKENIPYLFGDMSDEEILNQTNISKAKIIISTNPDLEDNLNLIAKAKSRNPKIKIIVRASYPEQEDELYRAGADYVIIPYLLGGKHIAHLLSEHNRDLDKYLEAKKNGRLTPAI